MEMKSAQRFFFPVLLLILAYEWIISSVNKVMSKNYFHGVQNTMSQSLSAIQLHPYASLLKTVGMHQVRLFGTLVLLGEVFVGISFVILAVQLMKHKLTSSSAKLGIVAAIVAAFMSLNYAVLGGDTVFVDPTNAFQEGISIDWILCAIEVTLAFFFFSYSRHHKG